MIRVLAHYFVFFTDFFQMLNCCIQKRIKRENINAASDDSDDQNLPTKCNGFHLEKNLSNV